MSDKGRKGEHRAMSKTSAPMCEPQDTLPIAASSESDATECLIGMSLKEGQNHVERNKAGLELTVRARAGRPLEYVILDAAGNPLDEVVRVTVVNKATKRTTCWECGVDADGNRHCWKVTCPDIVGPWDHGKVVALGFRLF